jgi:hypothetical protein
MRRVDDRAGAEKQQCLEKGVGEQVKDGGNPRAHAER